MPKRTWQEIRNAILKVLGDGKEHTHGSLERKVNTDWQTIRKHCQELELYGAVLIKNNKIKITEQGKKILNKIKKKEP